MPTGYQPRDWGLGRRASWAVHGWCMGGAWLLPGLVRLDLGVGGGLDGYGEEVVGVVSCEMGIYLFVSNLGSIFYLKKQ